jgi:hypothetical protein
MSGVSGVGAVTRANVEGLLWLEQVRVAVEYTGAERHVGQIVLVIGGN